MLIHPDQDGDNYDVGVLPDQRSPAAPAINLQLQVSGQVTPQELANHLVKLAQTLQRGELWEKLGGAPLGEPQTFRLVPSDQAPAARQEAHKAPESSAQQTPLHTLQTLRDRVASRLAELRHDPTFPLRGHSLEELCEALTMLTCGQDIALLMDRVPWRWEHRAEELRVEEEIFGEELQILGALIIELSLVLGAEPAAERLFSVFIEGGQGRVTMITIT